MYGKICRKYYTEIRKIRANFLFLSSISIEKSLSQVEGRNTKSKVVIFPWFLGQFDIFQNYFGGLGLGVSMQHCRNQPSKNIEKTDISKDTSKNPKFFGQFCQRIRRNKNFIYDCSGWSSWKINNIQFWQIIYKFLVPLESFNQNHNYSEMLQIFAKISNIMDNLQIMSNFCVFP